MVITLVQMNSVIGDFMGNARHLVDLARRTCAGIQNAFNGPDNSTGLGSNPKADKAKGLPDLLVFPELCLCGYPPMDLLDQNAFVAGNLAALRYLQKELPSDLPVAVGYVDRNRSGSGRALVNAMSVISGGKVVFTQHKTLLPILAV